MALANDQKRWARITPETAWGTLPGSPVWTLLKITKLTHTPKTSLEFAKEWRNSADMLYEDSIASGGAIEEWDLSFKLRADQTPHFFRAVGFDDTKTTHAGETAVYDHTMKPGTGASYSIQFYDGQLCYQGLGLVLTNLELSGKAGETGVIEGSAKGWSKKSTTITPPTITLPGNTAYRMLKPTNTGVAIALGGGTANSMLSDWKLSWKRDAVPHFSQTGTVDPYRPKYGERQLDVEVSLIFDDTADYAVAMAVPVVTQSLVITLPHTESTGVVPTKPGFVFTIPRFAYAEPKVDPQTGAPIASLKGKALYDTTLGGQWSALITNEITTAY